MSPRASSTRQTSPAEVLTRREESFRSRVWVRHGTRASGYAAAVLAILLCGAAAMAGPYDTTELVVLATPTAVAVTWRASPSWEGVTVPGPLSCKVSLTVEDDAHVFNTNTCNAAAQPLVAQALKSAKARPVEELGWGLKSWTTLAVTLTPGPQGLSVQLLPGGSGLVPERHHSQVTVREDVPPLYPQDASWRSVPGDCLVHLRIDEKGRPTEATALRCTAGFADASLEALKQWRFVPHRVDGELTPYDTIWPLHYRMTPEQGLVSVQP